MNVDCSSKVLDSHCYPHVSESFTEACTENLAGTDHTDRHASWPITSRDWIDILLDEILTRFCLTMRNLSYSRLICDRWHIEILIRLEHVSAS